MRLAETFLMLPSDPIEPLGVRRRRTVGIVSARRQVVKKKVDPRSVHDHMVSWEEFVQAVQDDEDLLCMLLPESVLNQDDSTGKS